MSMRVVYSGLFLENAKLLPHKTQYKLDNLVALMADNPFHPLLHSKRLSGNLKGKLSFRITRDWRVIFQFTNDSTIQLIDVANRKDIYRR